MVLNGFELGLIEDSHFIILTLEETVSPLRDYINIEQVKQWFKTIEEVFVTKDNEGRL